ncbi:MAG: nucleotidyltransferase domain-containing protein [Phycisphaerales bacterium]
MDQRTIADKSRDFLSTDESFRLAYLFGSQVSGRTGPMSDIDIGILFSRDVDIPQTMPELAHKLTIIFQGTPVEIVPLNQAPVELAYSVIAQGICIYRVSEVERVEFEANVLGRYGDYLPVLRAMRRDILEGEKDGYRVQRYREAFRRTERTLGEIRASEKQITQ